MLTSAKLTGRSGATSWSFEQDGKARAAYGKGLLDRLSGDLTLCPGKGFSRSNLSRFRQLYLGYPICATVS
ncbi:MAG: hypothetical protein JWR15_1218, partial [Prosthecobacter sp.]|nr:hypothetical protein [Prosthecobacter sp.]